MMLYIIVAITLLQVVSSSHHVPDLKHELGWDGLCYQMGRSMCYCFKMDPTTHKFGVKAAYFCEWGYELVLHLPYTYFLFTHGVLQATAGPLGSTALHYYSPHHTELTTVLRHACIGPPNNPDLHALHPNFDEYEPPNLAAHYHNLSIQYQLSFDPPVNAGRELLIIHNKYAVEWGGPPVNFLDTPTLRALFTMLQDRYQLVYINQGLNDRRFDAEKVHLDDVQHMSLGDAELLREFPSVRTMAQVQSLNKINVTYNILQLALHSRCKNFISVQGGNSILASYFGGTNLVYTVRGSELSRVPNSYHRFYRYLSNATVISTNSYGSLLDLVQKHYLQQELRNTTHLLQ